MDWHLEIFSLPQDIEDSRQFLLLRTIFHKKQSLGAPENVNGKKLTPGRSMGLDTL